MYSDIRNKYNRVIPRGLRKALILRVTENIIHHLFSLVHHFYTISCFLKSIFKKKKISGNHPEILKIMLVL